MQLSVMALVISVHNGDNNITVDVDLGMRTWQHGVKMHLPASMRRRHGGDEQAADFVLAMDA